MKLKFNVEGKCQADPFIFEDDGKFYLYVTARDGLEAYSADDIFGEWKYEGIVGTVEGWYGFWAPSVIKYEGKYYAYVSCVCEKDESKFEHMHVISADSPLGPFGNPKMLYDRFSIDSHAVATEDGLFLWYAENSRDGERIGTRVFVDRLIDPYTPANICKEVIVPTFDEEIFTPSYRKDNPWHTIEGAFWFKEGDWQYVMYSGGCFEDDTYHVGYASAKTDESDLTKIDFVKHTADGKFAPVLIKNEYEEGTGHHSVIKHNGEYYAIYHARDYAEKMTDEYVEARTARICKLHVKDGIITAERYENKV